MKPEIKPLVWEFHDGRSTCGSWVADCIYRYVVDLPCGTPTYKAWASGRKLGSFRTLEAAKRAAQQDLEKTVLSAVANAA